MKTVESFGVMESFGFNELKPDEMMNVNGGVFDLTTCFTITICFTYSKTETGGGEKKEEKKSDSGNKSSSESKKEGEKNIGVISNPDVGKAL